MKKNDDSKMIQVDEEYLFQLEFFVCSLNDFLKNKKRPLNDVEIFALSKTNYIMDNMDEERKAHAVKSHQDFMKNFK